MEAKSPRNHLLQWTENYQKKNYVNGKKKEKLIQLTVRWKFGKDWKFLLINYNWIKENFCIKKILFLLAVWKDIAIS